MGAQKKDISFTKVKHNLRRIPFDLGRYYQRYLRMINLGPQEMERIESFWLMKKWCRGRVLDIGCGLGYLTHYFGACGVDKNEKIISAAKNLYPNSDFYVWDNYYNVADESFDTIVCYNLIEHLTENERGCLFKKINRLLVREGRVIFGYADPYDLLQLFKGFFSQSAFFDPTHIYNWPTKQFEQIIGTEFNIIKSSRASPFTKCVGITKHFKGDILMLCSVRK